MRAEYLLYRNNKLNKIKMIKRLKELINKKNQRKSLKKNKILKNDCNQLIIQFIRLINQIRIKGLVMKKKAGLKVRVLKKFGN